MLRSPKSLVKANNHGAMIDSGPANTVVKL
jgi:hypothetical protein